MMIKILSYFLVMVYVSSVYGMDHVEKVESDKNRSSGKIDNQESSENDVSELKSDVLPSGDTIYYTLYQGYKVPYPEMVWGPELFVNLGMPEKPDNRGLDEKSFFPVLLEREKYPSWRDYWVALMKCYEKNEGHSWEERIKQDWEEFRKQLSKNSKNNDFDKPCALKIHHPS